MADATKSLWSRLMEGGTDNLSNVEAAKRACPYDRKSCTKAKGAVAEDSPISSGRKCHLGCPEPKRPLQPEEFCPDLGRAKLPTPPTCCFIRMQDPCAPCCCPPPDKCEDECHPGPKRDPICGCDLCKKRQCPDGKCCGPTEPSCQKAVGRCNAESQTLPVYSKALESKVSDVHKNPEHLYEPPICRCRKDYIALLEFIKRPLDWLLCTPLKIPIPRIEWQYMKTPKPEEDRCNSTLSRSVPEEKSSLLSPLPDGDASRRPRCCDPHYSMESKNAAQRTHGKAIRNEDTQENQYFQDKPSCECGPCRVRRLFGEACAEQTDTTKEDKWLENGHLNACGCRLCRVRRALQKPTC